MPATSSFWFRSRPLTMTKPEEREKENMTDNELSNKQI